MNPDEVTLDGQPLNVLAQGVGFIFAEYGPDKFNPKGYVVFRTDPVDILYKGISLSAAYDVYMELLGHEVPGKASHPNLYPSPLPPARGKVSNRTLVDRLGEHIPDFYEETDCPGEGCGRIGTIYTVVQHVNDDHGWTREAVADWLETLDLDLTVHQDKVRESGVKRGPVYYPILDGAPVQGAWIDGAQGVSTEVLDSLPASLPKMKVSPLPISKEIDPEVVAKAMKAMTAALQPAIDAMSVAMKAIESTANSPEFQAFVEQMKANAEKKEQS